MKYVEIYKLQNDGSQIVYATCKLVWEMVICEGDEILISNLTKDGIRDYSAARFKKVFPKDGLNIGIICLYNFLDL